MRIYLNRESIEKRIMEFNNNHYKKVLHTNTVTNKIYDKLQEDNIRNRILSRTLESSECNHPEVYEFLSLLKKQSFETLTLFEPINIEEWTQVV